MKFFLFSTNSYKKVINNQLWSISTYYFAISIKLLHGSTKLYMVNALLMLHRYALIS